jgi:Ca2+-binding RTX toxin-like protein
VFDTPGNDSPYVAGSISDPATAPLSGYMPSPYFSQFSEAPPAPSVRLDDGTFLLAYRVAANIVGGGFNAFTANGTAAIAAPGGVPSSFLIFNAIEASLGSAQYLLFGLGAGNVPTVVAVEPVGDRIMVTDEILAQFAPGSSITLVVNGLMPGSNLFGVVEIDQLYTYDPAGPHMTLPAFAVPATVNPSGTVTFLALAGQAESFTLVNSGAWTTQDTQFQLVIDTASQIDLSAIAGAILLDNQFIGNGWRSVITVTAVNGVVEVPPTVLQQLQSHPGSVSLSAINAVPGALAQASVEIELPVTTVEEGLYVQHFDAQGQALSGAVRIDDVDSALIESFAGDDGIDFAMSFGGDGTLIANWLGDSDGDGFGDTIYTRHLDLSGQPLGDARALSGVAPAAIAGLGGNVVMAPVAGLADGGYALAYGQSVATLSFFIQGQTPSGNASFFPAAGQLTSFQLVQFTPGANLTATLRGENSAGALVAVQVALIDGGFVVTDAMRAQFAPDSHLVVTVSGLAAGSPFEAFVETQDSFVYDASSTLSTVTRSGTAANAPGAVADITATSLTGQVVSFQLNAITPNPAEVQNYYLILSSTRPLDFTGLTVAGPANNFANGAYNTTLLISPVGGVIEVPASLLDQVPDDGLRATLGISGLTAGSAFNIGVTVRHPSEILEPGVFTQQFDALGNAVGLPERIDDPDAGLASTMPPSDEPRITIAPDGDGWRVSWLADTNSDGDADTIVSRGFDSAGNPLGASATLDLANWSFLAEQTAAGSEITTSEELGLVRLGDGGFALMVQSDALPSFSGFSAQSDGGPVFIAAPAGRLARVTIEGVTEAASGSLHYYLIGNDAVGAPVVIEVVPGGNGQIVVSDALLANFSPDSELVVMVEGTQPGSFVGGTLATEDVWNFGPGGTTTTFQIDATAAADQIGFVAPLLGEATAFQVLNAVTAGPNPVSYFLSVRSAVPTGLPGEGFDFQSQLYLNFIPVNLDNGTITVPPAVLAAGEAQHVSIVLVAIGLQAGSQFTVEAAVRLPVATVNEGLFVQLFDAAGVAQGAPIRVDAEFPALEGLDIALASIKPDGSGGFLVTWKADTDGDGNPETYVIRRFDAEGNPLGDATAISDVPDRIYDENTPVTIYTAGIFADPDQGDTLAFSADGLPSGLAIDPLTGVISGAARQSGLFTVEVTATDSGGLSASSSFTLLVLDDGSTNQVPVASDQPEAFVGLEDLLVSGTLLTGSDPDGDPLTFIAGTASNGSVTIDPDTGEFVFTPDADYSGPASFTYRVSDGSLASDLKTVTLSFAAVNDAPSAIALANTLATTPENGGLVKVADIAVSDDGIGTNVLSLSGADAARFTIIGTALYFNGSGDFEAQNTFDVTVSVSDPDFPGTTSSASFHLALSDVAEAKAYNGTQQGDQFAVNPVSIDNWTIQGNAGNDQLSGGAGLDQLFGGAGADVLSGGDGADRLTGGTGRDVLIGGEGDDRFVFARPGDSSPGRNADHITDFELGDLIDLSLIDANSGAAGNQAFDWIGLGAFTGTAGQLRYQVIEGDTHLYGDTNGDRQADFEIVLDQITELPPPGIFLIG